MEYKVSRPTAELVEAFDKVDEIYTLAYSALFRLYPEDSVLKMTDGRFLSSLDAAKDELGKMIARSMIECGAREKRSEI